MTLTLPVFMVLLAIVIDHAHLVSPVAVAWGHGGFRQHMLGRPIRFLVVPGAILVAGATIGLTSARESWVFEGVVGLYVVWNAWHFAAQNYGLLALAGWRRTGAPVGAATFLCLLVWPIGPWIARGLSWSHWLSDIGLSWKALGWHWVFLVGVLVAGTAGFVFAAVGCNAHGCVQMVSSIPVILSIRMSLGFVHFLYSRLVWASSSPVVAGLRDRGRSTGPLCPVPA